MADLTYYRKQYIFYLLSFYTVSSKTGFELQQKIRFTLSAQRPVLSYSRKSTTPVIKSRFSLADLTYYRKQYIFYLPSFYTVSPKTGFELQKIKQLQRKNSSFFFRNYYIALMNYKVLDCFAMVGILNFIAVFSQKEVMK